MRGALDKVVRVDLTGLAHAIQKRENISRCTLLREAYREDEKKNRTIANLTHCNPKEVEALSPALKYKHDLTELTSLKEVELRHGLSMGAVWLIARIAEETGIEKALGTDRQGKPALWQLCARIIDQGSRLSAVRLAGIHAACDILGITESFTEDHLCENLAWLADHQKTIEDRLFHTWTKPELFLYDVTSSYLEGVFAEWGRNRDKNRFIWPLMSIVNTKYFHATSLLFHF